MRGNRKEKHQMSNTACVIRFDEATPVDRGRGVKTTPLVGKWSGSTSLTNGTTSFEPGAAIALHYHNCDESVVVLEGEARCEIDGKVYPMRALDTTFIPAGVPHRFWNESNQPMRILWTYASAEVTRTFVETGETVPHLSAADRAVVEK
jgi:quercetin dioxygenase-like cupin family protein